MNNLKQYAGLLNEVAPKGEFLAYINEDESKILKEAGASGLLTPQGIPSYRGAGGYQGGSTSSGSSSSSSSSGSSSSEGGGGGRDTGSDYGQFDRAVKQAANNPRSTPSIDDNEPSDIENFYQDRIQRIASGVEPTSQPFDQRSDLAKTGDSIMDFVAGGGITGAVIRGLNDFAQKQNKARRNEFLSGVDEYGMPRSRDFYIGNGRAFNPDAVLNENSEEYSFLQDSGYFNQFDSPEYNEDNPSTYFDNPQDYNLDNLVNNPNPFSQVNSYFKNMGSNLGVSSAYMDTYNAAKTKIANTLNLTSNNNQYGYGNSFNQNYARSMTSANPFFDELTNQGLI